MEKVIEQFEKMAKGGSRAQAVRTVVIVAGVVAVAAFGVDLNLTVGG